MAVWKMMKFLLLIIEHSLTVIVTKKIWKNSIVAVTIYSHNLAKIAENKKFLTLSAIL